MKLSLGKKMLVLALVLPLAAAIVGYSPLSVGQEKPAAKKEEAKPKGRLPPYYTDVVTEAQRNTIYAIQAKYDKELKALNEQLAATIKKQNDEIVAVLSDEQKAKVEAARNAANDKKKKKTTEGEKKPETK